MSSSLIEQAHVVLYVVHQRSDLPANSADLPGAREVPWSNGDHKGEIRDQQRFVFAPILSADDQRPSPGLHTARRSSAAAPRTDRPSARQRASRAQWDPRTLRRHSISCRDATAMCMCGGVHPTRLKLQRPCRDALVLGQMLPLGIPDLRQQLSCQVAVVHWLQLLMVALHGCAPDMSQHPVGWRNGTRLLERSPTCNGICTPASPTRP